MSSGPRGRGHSHDVSDSKVPDMLGNSSRFTELQQVVTAQRRRHKRWVLVSMIGLRLALSLPVVIVAPFYPQQLYRWIPKNEASLYTGIVMGSAAVTTPIGSFLASQWLLKDIGARAILSLGFALVGGTTVLFGCLQYVDAFNAFFSLSLLIRLLQGFGSGATDVVVYGLGTTSSEEQIGLAAGLLEQSFGLGVAVGPAAGGALHGVGGFGLPLFVVGGLTLACVLVPLVVLSSRDRLSSQKVSVLKVANVWVISSAIYGGLLPNISLFYLSSTLADFLDLEFGLSPTTIGLFFLLSGVWSALACPISGMLAEHVQPRWVVLVGMLISAAGMAIVALTHKLPLQLLGQVVIGVGNGISSGSVFRNMACEADSAGHGSSEERNASLATILFTCYAIGSIIGSTVGGALASTLGFSTATLCVSGALAVPAIVYGIVFMTFRHS